MSTPTLYRELLGRGFSDVTVPDVSQEALRTAKAQMADPGAVSWVHADLHGWTPTRRWDVWHDRAVFHFLTEPHEREAYRRLLDVAVAPGEWCSSRRSPPKDPGPAPVCRYVATTRRTCSSSWAQGSPRWLVGVSSTPPLRVCRNR
ncbi:MAG: hypothetical protein M5U19_17940 [Microthrixaceae bacterium]|nr:hypothetical protein [Microthrixaceae bacterium]